MLRQSRPERRRRARERHRARTVCWKMRACGSWLPCRERRTATTDESKTIEPRRWTWTDRRVCVRACVRRRTRVCDVRIDAGIDRRSTMDDDDVTRDHFTNHDSGGGTHSVCPRTRTNRDRDDDDDRRRRSTTRARAIGVKSRTL